MAFDKIPYIFCYGYSDSCLFLQKPQLVIQFLFLNMLCSKSAIPQAYIQYTLTALDSYSLAPLAFG